MRVCNMNISNEEIVERVMRMGIEFRSGVSLDDLYGLASNQLRESAKRHLNRIEPEHSFSYWQSQARPFAMMRDKILRICIVDDTSTVKLVRWVTPFLPEVALCQ